MKQFNDDLMLSFKREYRQKGYILIKHFFNEREVNELRLWIEEVIDWPIVTGKWLKYFELLNNQDKVLSRIEHFVEFHPGFKRLVHDKDFLSILSDFLGEPALFFKEKLNLKTPGAKGYTPHQDAPAFFDIEYDAITIFAPVDPCTVESGCLYFVKDGAGFKPEMLKQNDNNRALSKEVIDSLCWEPIECMPGDVIIFSSYAPHYSKENLGKQDRRVVFLTFGRKMQSLNKTHVYYDKKRKIFPQDSEKIPGVDYTEAAKIYSYSSPVIVNVNSGS